MKTNLNSTTYSNPAIAFLFAFLLPLPSDAQWLRIDTLFTQAMCQSPPHYRAHVAIPGPDTAYYYYNNEQCSPSGGSNVRYELFRTTDAFQSWQLIATDFYSSMTCLKFLNGNTGFASKNVFGMNSFMKTNDAGNTWTTIETFPLIGQSPYFDIFMFNVDSGYTISYDGIVRKYSGAALQIMNINSSTPIFYPKIKFTADNKGFILSTDSINTPYLRRLLRSTDNGITWNTVLFDSSGYFLELEFADNTSGYLTGTAGVYKTSDGGANWNLINVSPAYCNQLAVVDSTTLYITKSNSIYSSQDGGLTWQFQAMPSNPIPTNQAPLDIIMLDSNTGFVTATNGIYNELYRTTNGGLLQGITEPEKSAALPRLFPNPARNFTKIMMPSSFVGAHMEISIYSTTGTCLNSFSFQTTEETLLLDLNTLSAGLYFVVLKNPKSFHVLKLIIN